MFAFTRSFAGRNFIQASLILALAALPASARPVPKKASSASPSHQSVQSTPSSRPPQGIQADGSLDRNLLHQLYMDGDFDKVEQSLEYFRAHNDSMSNADKIVVYKYLGVIYSSRPETRTKGEGYLFSLLQLVPTITLLDMYISDTVESIFAGVRQRYVTMEKEMVADKKSDSTADAAVKPQAAKPDLAAATPQPKPIETGAKPAKEHHEKSSKGTWIAWTAAGAAATTAVAVYFIASSPDPKKEKYLLGRP